MHARAGEKSKAEHLAVKRRRDRMRAQRDGKEVEPAPISGFRPPWYFESIYAVFLKINGKRHYDGMSGAPRPLDSSEIEAWERRHGRKLTLWEEFMIDGLDVAYRNGVGAALKANRASEENRRKLSGRNSSRHGGHSQRNRVRG